jgi:nicotinate-nucleotide adenylyltransferase
VCAQEAVIALALDRVLLLPTNTPPHKEAEADPGAAHRVEMCRRAVGDDPRLGVCDIELERPGPSYTVDTLRELHAREPESELTFIVGGDMALSLSEWRAPDAVLAMARLGVSERAGAPRADIEARLAAFGAAGRIDYFAMPRIDISSTDLRRRVAAGRPIRYLVPEAVAAYVEEQGLYRELATV